MRYLTLRSFPIQTPSGRKDIQAGLFLNLPEERAKPLIEAGLIEPLKKTLERLFREHSRRMGEFTLTMQEIKEDAPALHEQIRQAVKGIDKAWVAEDLAGVKKAMANVESLYQEAVNMRNNLVESIRSDFQELR